MALVPAPRMKDRCGSQPASLNQVHDRRRPLKAHQSESYLPLGKSQPRECSAAVGDYYLRSHTTHRKYS